MNSFAENISNNSNFNFIRYLRHRNCRRLPVYHNDKDNIFLSQTRTFSFRKQPMLMTPRTSQTKWGITLLANFNLTNPINISSKIIYRSRNLPGLRRKSAISWFLSIISKKVTFIGRPERCKSFVDVRLHSNSFTQYAINFFLHFSILKWTCFSPKKLLKSSLFINNFYFK